MADDATVLRDDRMAYDDGEIVRIRFLAVPQSDIYPRGIKYSFHYGIAGTDTPIIRFDNHHGPHEIHLGPTSYEFDFPGLEYLTECFVAALPEAKRKDWN